MHLNVSDGCINILINTKYEGHDEGMIITTLQIRLHFPWVHSLKEKRMEVKSLCVKARNKFNISVAEIDEQDIHQIAVLSFAGIAGDRAQADSIIDNILNFVEENTEGEIVAVEREII